MSETAFSGGNRIVVFGDLMLDVSQNGSASRLSPEAPVVVLANPVATSALGGAGNTAANVHTLGHPTTLVGLIGQDPAADEVDDLIRGLGIESATVRTSDICTTVKTRFLANGHQIMRLDNESDSVSKTSETALSEATAKVLVGAGGLVLSDYDKGALSPGLARELVSLARGQGMPIVVDSKKNDVEVFAGVTVIAPNHLEAFNITGQRDPERAAEIIAERMQGAVVLTMGADGMLVHDGPHSVRIESEAREVSDVTGAGDTVTAGLAVALSEGASVVEAARWANAAAALAVEHKGTFAVQRSSVEASLEIAKA